jgi:hypothetical protein
MAKIRQTQAEAIYDSLKKTIHNCIKENDWEFYKGKALIVGKQIKDIKNYIENVPFPVARDYKWAGDLEVFEAAYYKMIYYKDLWSASDWILYTLQNETRKEIRIITIKHVNLFIEALLSFQLIKTYRGQISKIINANVSGKQLLLMYEHIRTLTDGFREKLEDTLYITESYKLNEGFYNPFDNDENKSEDIVSNNKDIEERLIRKIKVYNSKNQEGGIKYKNNGVYANTTFYKDDVIEEAPVYILHDSDLYSANVRQLTFMIDSSKRIFGIPMGMATVARYADEAKKEANIDYEFDPENGNKIVIYATRKIKRGEELIFAEDNICESGNTYDICSAPLDLIRSVEPSNSGVSKSDPVHSGQPYKAMA